jgi:hypothetical protein
MRGRTDTWENRKMEIVVLLEPLQGGGFRARAGEPFGVSADGQTASEASQHLADLLRDRLKAGARVAVLDLGNGSQVLPQAPLQFEPLPDDDWFFQGLREAIAENRQREDNAMMADVSLQLPAVERSPQPANAI